MTHSQHIRKYSITISGHATSISLEPEFWEELKKIGKTQKISMKQLITEIDNTRTGNLSSALRLYVLQSLKQKRS